MRCKSETCLATQCPALFTGSFPLVSICLLFRYLSPLLLALVVTDRSRLSVSENDSKSGRATSGIRERKGEVGRPGALTIRPKFSKFSKRGQMVRKFPGKSSRKSGNSGMKVKWNGNFQEKNFESLGTPHELVLFFGIYANSQFSTQR